LLVTNQERVVNPMKRAGSSGSPRTFKKIPGLGGLLSQNASSCMTV
jgi:hypothetical protein